MVRFFTPITYTLFNSHWLMDYTEIRKEQTLRSCHQWLRLGSEDHFYTAP
jgi:hypothetical protein